MKRITHIFILLFTVVCVAQETGTISGKLIDKEDIVGDIELF